MKKMKYIKIPIYWAETDDGEVKIDAESMREEHDNLLNDIITNPEKYI